MAVVPLSGCSSKELLKRDRSAGFNGGFEASEAGVPVNWAFFPNPDVDNTLRVFLDSSRVIEGRQSLKLEVRASEKLPAFRSGQVPVQAGRDYRLSVAFQNEGCNLKANRIVLDASGKTVLRRDIIIDTSASSAGWETFEETLSVSEREAQVMMVFMIEGSGTVWFDDVKVEATTP